MNSSLSLANLLLASLDELEPSATTAVEIRMLATTIKSLMAPRLYSKRACGGHTIFSLYTPRSAPAPPLPRLEPALSGLGSGASDRRLPIKASASHRVRRDRGL